MSKYLNLDWNTSQMYEWSKTQKDDSFVEAPNGNGFRKHYKEGVFGELQSVGVIEGKFGQQLSISVREKGEFINMLFSLYDQNSNVDGSFAEQIIRYLGNLEKGQYYRFFPYALSAEDQRKLDEEDSEREVKEKYYEKRGISIKKADAESHSVGEKVEAALKYVGKGDNIIPKVLWKENTMGKRRPTAVTLEEKNEFLLGRLKEASEGHLKFEKLTPTEISPPDSQPSKKAKEPVEDNDDLPF